MPGSPHPSTAESVPFGLMLFSVIAVFVLPVIVLVHAAHDGADHAPGDLAAHARRAVERGEAVEARVVAAPVVTVDQPRP